MASESLGIHAHEHGNAAVNVIVHTDFLLALVSPVQPASVLLESPAPGDWHGKEERIQPGVVETLSDISSCGEDHAGLFRRDLPDAFLCRAALAPAHSPAEDNDVLDLPTQ